MYTTRILQFMAGAVDAYRALDNPAGFRFEISLILADSDRASSTIGMRISNGGKMAHFSIDAWSIEISIAPASEMAEYEVERLARSIREGI